MTKTTIELLREAREWLSDRSHWCAHTRHGLNNTSCALGALERSAGDGVWDAWFRGEPCGMELAFAIQDLANAARDLGQSSTPGMNVCASLWVANFNDRNGWLGTLKMFDLAIKKLEEEMDRQAKKLVESSEVELVAK